MIKSPDSRKNLELEYFFLNNTYNLDAKRDEKMMCVVATGMNLFKDRSYKYFFRSLDRQNYTNFKVFHVDDASEDNTTLRLAAYI